jgi:hypothetical protein
MQKETAPLQGRPPFCCRDAQIGRLYVVVIVVMRYYQYAAFTR